MKKFVVLLMAAFCEAVSLCAADNAVSNGDFAKLDKKGAAVGWRADAKTVPPVFVAKNDKDPSFVRFSKPAGYKGTNAFCIRQYITKNVTANAEYELSFKARGVNFAAARKNINVMVIREGWTQSSGLYKFEPTSEWKTFKKTIKMVDFKKYAVMVINGFIAKGAVEITDVTLTAVK